MLIIKSLFINEFGQIALSHYYLRTVKLTRASPTNTVQIAVCKWSYIFTRLTCMLLAITTRIHTIVETVRASIVF